ncbi:GDSL esterase/lipase [Sesamum angolense]|uniref:GDSL esterase/lipase n=1 Tax=Sesamum angolense TaxID=2727404 RepID=A0AAE1WM69_9LAMI|nr:GDSL esterase/lipase [Sesamum angolense]
MRKGIAEEGRQVCCRSRPTADRLPNVVNVSRPSDDRDAVGCVGSPNKQSYTHNLALKAKLDGFRKQYPQSIILYLDYYSAYLTVVKNARQHGMTEVYKACCGYGGGTYNFDYFNACGSPSASSCANPSQYINWDGVHLTEAMYKAMADAFLNGTYSQPPFSYLLSRNDVQDEKGSIDAMLLCR